MTLRYPLFVVDTDGWVHVVSAERGLSYFEQIDIEDHEYHGWDCDGLPLDLTWSNQLGVGVTAKELSTEPRSLLDALRRWAVLERVEIGSDEQDPVKIGEIVEAILRERRSRSLLDRLLSFVRGGKP